MNANPPAASSPTRDAILRAAARVFAQAGYRAATVQAIAKEAGFTPPTVYAHFGTKQGLLDGLVEGLLGDMFSVLERPLPEGLTLAQRLELRVRDVLELAERRRYEFVLFILRPFDLPTPRDEPHEPDMLMRHWERELALHQAELGDRTPREAALILEGVLYAFVKTWLAADPQEVMPDARRMVDLVLHGLAGAA